MMTVNEVSTLTGVSVRTLHHYDAIGLLKPAQVSEAGYRLYDSKSLARLQTILFFRELMFPLKEIKSILDTPGFDLRAAMRDQLVMLAMQRDRIDRIIALARKICDTGCDNMDFNAFESYEFDAYKAEAKARWGNTKAYAQYAKSGNPSAADGLMDIIAELAALRPLEPSAPEAAAKVRALQAYITANFYECTDEILAGLGQMYVADERFKNNIDKHAGNGAAEYVSAAIANCIK